MPALPQTPPPLRSISSRFAYAGKVRTELREQRIAVRSISSPGFQVASRCAPGATGCRRGTGRFPQPTGARAARPARAAFSSLSRASCCAFQNSNTPSGKVTAMISVAIHACIGQPRPRSSSVRAFKSAIQRCSPNYYHETAVAPCSNRMNDRRPSATCCRHATFASLPSVRGGVRYARVPRSYAISPMLTRTAPRERSLKSLSPHGFHRVVWHEWGDPANPRVVICVHGLTRTGRDFDVLGEALARSHRVLAVDMPGRGRSEWLPAKADYVYTTYLTTLTALIAASGAESVDWVGTSMGGLLGIVMAAQPATPIARLVVNDVGPAIEQAALARIGTYVGADPDVRERGRAHRVRPRDFAVRPARRCAVGAPGAHDDVPTSGWPLRLRLRPRDRRAVSRSGGRGRPLAALGCDRDARRSCCAAPSPTCCPRRRRER